MAEQRETSPGDTVQTLRERARRRLAEADARHDAAYWEQLRARFGVTAEPV